MVLELIEEHPAMVALPLTIQPIVAVGALAPVGAVRVAVKVRVELSVPPPVPIKLNVGVTFAMVMVLEDAVTPGL